MTMDRRIDLAGSLVIIALGLGVIVYAFQFPHPAIQYDVFGPMGVPLLLGAGLAIGGAVQSWRTWRLLKEYGPLGAPEGTEDEPGQPAVGARGIAFVGGSLLYIAALAPIGYLIATPVAMAIGLYALRFRTWWKLLLAVVGFTLVSFGIFNYVLSVPIPVGILNDLLVGLGLIERFR